MSKRMRVGLSGNCIVNAGAPDTLIAPLAGVTIVTPPSATVLSWMTAARSGSGTLSFAVYQTSQPVRLNGTALAGGAVGG